MQRAAAAGAALLAVPASVAAWDYQTRTGLRRLRPWRPEDCGTRCRNLVVAQVPQLVPLYSMADLGQHRGQPADASESTGGARTVLFSAKGAVYDVTGIELFAPGGAYGDLWAGRDATVALAKTSLDVSLCNSTAWSESELTKEELEDLAKWQLHFDAKYSRVGRLREWEESHKTL